MVSLAYDVAAVGFRPVLDVAIAIYLIRSPASWHVVFGSHWGVLGS